MRQVHFHGGSVDIWHDVDVTGRKLGYVAVTYGAAVPALDLLVFSIRLVVYRMMLRCRLKPSVPSLTVTGV